MDWFKLYTPTQVQGKRDTMETLDQESTDDDSEEASHYPYGLCYKARDEDECLFNQKSNFSNFEAECN